MTHLTDEDLLAFHWDGNRRGGRHLAGCAECARALDELRSLLRAVEHAPVPDRGEAYGREMWTQIASRLSENPSRSDSASRAWGSRSSWLSARRLRLGAAAAVLVGAAFLAGRLAATRGSAAPGFSAEAASRRVLFVDLGRHLDRSESVLLELVHAPFDGRGSQDVSAEQARLSDLLPANRLYRQTARRAGDPALSGLLDDIERVLLDVQHGPPRLTLPERDALRARIEAEGILFRLRILLSRVREREREGEKENPPEGERDRGNSTSRQSIERKRA